MHCKLLSTLIQCVEPRFYYMLGHCSSLWESGILNAMLADQLNWDQLAYLRNRLTNSKNRSNRIHPATFV